MYKYITVFFIVFLFTFSTLYAQTATIQGTIQTENNQPAEYAAIRLKNTKLHTVANDKGEYVLQHLNAGNYILIINFTGYETKQQPVTINENDNLIVNITLLATSDTLQTVEVTGRKQSSYKNDNSFSASKIE